MVAVMPYSIMQGMGLCTQSLVKNRKGDTWATIFYILTEVRDTGEEYDRTENIRRILDSLWLPVRVDEPTIEPMDGPSVWQWTVVINTSGSDNQRGMVQQLLRKVERENGVRVDYFEDLDATEYD